MRSWQNVFVRLAVLTPFVSACDGGPSHSLPPHPAVVVRWEERRQHITGFGASSAWTAPFLSDALADQFFSTESGIGLSLLRLRIAPDATTGELETARAAVARGARVWAAPWSPPGEWKLRPDDAEQGRRFDMSRGLYGGRLMKEHYSDWARELAAFVKDVEEQGIELMALSVQNEPDYEAPWETCRWTPEELTEFVRDHLIPALDAEGLDTPLLAPEATGWSSVARYADPLLEDATTRAAIRFVATHGYNGAPYAYETPSEHGKEFWQTEVSEENGPAGDTGMASGAWLGIRIHNDLTRANLNAWHYWWLLPRGDVPTDSNSALVQDGAFTRRAYVLGNFSRFVRPGSVRVETAPAAPGGNIYVSAYQSPDARELIVVAVNASPVDVDQELELAGVEVAELTPWLTSEDAALEPQAPVAVDSATFRYTLPTRSVTTFVGSLSD